MERIRAEGGLGLFVRSLIGLDRAAAKRAFDGFIQGRNLTAHQLEFLDMMIEHLTARGAMDPQLLCESPIHRYRSSRRRWPVQGRRGRRADSDSAGCAGPGGGMTDVSQTRI
jgi:type I site-specific restriction endonuclease